MITSFVDVAAFVLPLGVSAAAAAAFAGGASMRRQIPAAVAVARPHAADLGNVWAGRDLGTTGVSTKRTGTSYDPPSRGSTG
ncbi:MAG: hypothetical protein U0S36_03020 [Candidatus Nanopelagicales bacterium]